MVMKSNSAYEALFGPLPDLRVQAAATFTATLGKLDIVGGDRAAGRLRVGHQHDAQVAEHRSTRWSSLDIRRRWTCPACWPSLPAIRTSTCRSTRTGDAPALVFQPRAQHRWALLEAAGRRFPALGPDQHQLRGELQDGGPRRVNGRAGQRPIGIAPAPPRLRGDRLVSRRSGRPDTGHARTAPARTVRALVSTGLLAVLTTRPPARGRGLPAARPRVRPHRRNHRCARTSQR